MMVELSLLRMHLIRTRCLSIKMKRGLSSLRLVMYLSWQIIATSVEVTPNGASVRESSPKYPKFKFRNYRKVCPEFIFCVTLPETNIFAPEKGLFQ